MVQVEKDCALNEANSHIANIGRQVEDMENKMRNTLNEIYFGKTGNIVNDLRSVSLCLMHIIIDNMVECCGCSCVSDVFVVLVSIPGVAAAANVSLLCCPSAILQRFKRRRDTEFLCFGEYYKRLFDFRALFNQVYKLLDSIFLPN